MSELQVRTDTDVCPAVAAERSGRMRDYLHTAEYRIRKTILENSGKEESSGRPEMTIRRFLLIVENRHNGAFYDFLLQLHPGCRSAEPDFSGRRCLPGDTFVFRRGRPADDISGHGNDSFRVCAFLCFRAHAPPSAA